MFDLAPLILAAGLFGLLIGSFLNVCVFRLPRDLSVVTPRSFCTACGKTIAWYDNIPVISYLVLRAKCRACRAPIPWRYPALELATGLLFAAAVWRNGASPDALKLALFAAICIALIFMDLEYRILADELTIGGMVAGLLLSLFLPMPYFIGHLILPATWRESYLSLGEALIGCLLPGIALEIIAMLYKLVRGREGLGFGDVKMMALVGAFYGLEGALLTLMLGSIAGSVLGMAYITITKKDMSSYELPFGTFLGSAALVTAYVFAKPSGDLVVPW
jgi:leader peptidase (prepilin peptidase)/N-methyltransferase